VYKIEDRLKKGVRGGGLVHLGASGKIKWFRVLRSEGEKGVKAQGVCVVDHRTKNGHLEEYSSVR